MIRPIRVLVVDDSAVVRGLIARALEIDPDIVVSGTSMHGDDGIEETRTVAEHGGYMITQDEASSVVWGMPAAVARENLAHKILPLRQTAPTILHFCTAEACRT
jgi:chemotaxis response regulator CheB